MATTGTLLLATLVLQQATTGDALGMRPKIRSTRSFDQRYAQPSVGIESGPWGMDISGMKTSVRPGDDFDAYANGVWKSQTEIPADQTRWGSFDILQLDALEKVKSLLTSTLKPKGPGRLYASFVDEDRVEKLGNSPLLADIRRIQQLKDTTMFSDLVGECTSGFMPCPFGLYVGADPRDPEMNVLMLGQAGLGLPDRDYYLDDKYKDKKNAYLDHIKRVLALVEWPYASEAAAGVLSFEEAIARVSWSNVEQRDPIKTYNKMLVGDLPLKAPGFDWNSFLAAAGSVISNDTSIVASEFDARAGTGIVGIAKIIGETDMTSLRAWMAFHFVASASPYLSTEFVDEGFSFSKILSGQEEMTPRWRRAVGAVNSLMGDAAGEEYVKKYFPHDSVTKMEELTTALQTAFKKRLNNLSWMTDETKVKALEKLRNFKMEIGFPKKYHDYSGLETKSDDLFGNIRRAVAFEWAFTLGQLGQPVDHDYWYGPPQTVNAYFDPSANTCVFYAAILQPPFFNPSADMAVNFGAIGSVIGHEMTHGFDDQGRQHGADGSLQDWWTKADEEEFNRRADALGKQYAAYDTGIPNVTINPQLTMGENIADGGGLLIAYDAYKVWLQEQPSSELTLPLLGSTSDDGLESDRRFFAGWGQAWRGNVRDDALIEGLATDPHSPQRARAILPPRNIDAWYEAYGVEDSDAMYLKEKDRVSIW